MKYTGSLAMLMLLLVGTACNVVNSDPGPTQTAKEEVDGGKAEAVRAEIHMGAGGLHLDGGGPKLMTASFRYSEKIGRPTISYEAPNSSGVLTVKSPKDSTSTGNTVNEWDLRMDSGAQLELNVTVGAGKADLDLSRVSLKSLEVNMGAGELLLNVAGKYPRDVTVDVSSGVGEAKIRLPKNMGAVVDAKAGLGGINAKGLTQRDGKYYNAAYAEGKPAIRMTVRGGVGQVTLSAD